MKKIALAFLLFFSFYGKAEGAPQTVIQSDSIELNFDPNEDLGISKDSLDFDLLDLSVCTKIRAVYPVIRIWAKRTVKIQECFYTGTDLVEKLVIVTYYDSRFDVKWPIAFVRATRDSLGYEERWGLIDEGFAFTGKITRSWRTILPQENQNIQKQLVEVLRSGFDFAGRRDDLNQLPEDFRWCIQMIVQARNLQTGEEKSFPTPCDVPSGWEIIHY